MTDAAKPPTSKRTIFKDIDPAVIRHPLDRAATEQLTRLQGFDTLVKKYIEYGSERIYRVLNNASSVKVGPKQMPSLHQMLREGCAALDIPEPELYVRQGPVMNASTLGHTKPFIVLNSGLLNMDDEEVMTAIAHELGHIKCSHVLYLTMGYDIDLLIAIAKEFLPGIGHLIGMSMQWTVAIALLNWKRRAELSADRAALLVMQDPRPCISMLAKLACGASKLASELDAEEFLRQASSYVEEGDSGFSNRFYRFIVNAWFKGSHPFAVERAKYLNDWIDSPECDQILAGNYPRIPQRLPPGPMPGGAAFGMPPAGPFAGPPRGGPIPQPAQGKYCRRCGRLVSVADRFCPACGQPIAGQE